MEGTKPFFVFINSVRDRLIKGLCELFNGFREEVRKIRVAYILDHPTSFVATSMQQTYEQCLAISNPNHQLAEGKKKVYKKSTLHPRRVDHLRDKFKGTGEEPSVFEDVADSAKTAFQNLMSSWDKKYCTPKLAKAHDRILKDFNARFVVPEDVKTEENEEAIEKLKQSAYDALEIIQGPLKENLKLCEEYEKNGGV